MTGQQAVRLIDRLLSQAQQHKLNDLQSAIVVEIWDGHTYRSIADRLSYDLDYIKQIAARLWKSCSRLLGENICKSNIKSVLERHQESIPIALSRADEAAAEIPSIKTWVTSDSLEERISDRRYSIAFLCATENNKVPQSLKLDLLQVQCEIESLIWQNSHQPITPNVLMNEILNALTVINPGGKSINCLILNCYY